MAFLSPGRKCASKPFLWTSLAAEMVKNPPVMQETWVQSLAWEDQSPQRRHGNPLQYSCLENPHGQTSLTGYSSWGHRVGCDWVPKHIIAYLYFKAFSTNTVIQLHKWFLSICFIFYVYILYTRIWFPKGQSISILHSYTSKAKHCASQIVEIPDIFMNWWMTHTCWVSILSQNWE